MLKPEGVLSGHEEWITSLSVIQVSSTVLLLASGSKDNKIRLWRLVNAPYTFLNTNTSTNISTKSSNSSSMTNKMEIDSHQINISITTIPPEMSTDLITATTSALNAQDSEDDNDDEEEDQGIETANKINIIEDENDDVNMKNDAKLNFKIISHINATTDPTSTTTTTNNNGYMMHSIYLDALLLGHEDWVTSVHWMLLSPHQSMTRSTSTNINENQIRLFSTSMDRNMVIWSSDQVTGEL